MKRVGVRERERKSMWSENEETYKEEQKTRTEGGGGVDRPKERARKRMGEQ